jgi:UDP-4-amino-4-deoxy-L-arabinose-oxoglutarate aminotransferase
MKIPFYRHALTEKDASLVAQVIQGPFLTTGQRAAEVEDKLRKYFGVPNAKLTSSWTLGAFAALLALDVGPGDEVIVPAMTFVASANVVKLVGAQPVFVDVDPATLLIDIAAAQRAVTARTKAIIPVHLYGQMVDVRALRAAIGPGITIIEDAAHCFEGTRDGRRPGQDGDVAIFSFYATKNVTCGEGGAVISNDARFAANLTETVLHGMSASAAHRFSGGRYQHWDVARLGTKANLPDLLAVLLGPQIDTVEERLAKREALARRYEQAFADTPFGFPAVEPGVISARHLFPIHVSGGARDFVLASLNDRGIGATVNYRSVTDLMLYRDDEGVRRGRFDVAQAWGDGTLSLPLFPGLTIAEQDYVIGVLLNEIMPRLSNREQPENRMAAL